MAWTQADVDTKKAEIASMRKAIAYGDKSVTNFDLDQQLNLLAVMEMEAAASAGSSNGRSTYAVPSRG